MPHLVFYIRSGTMLQQQRRERRVPLKGDQMERGFFILFTVRCQRNGGGGAGKESNGAPVKITVSYCGSVLQVKD